MLLIDRLERLVRREYRRLFVFMPPGSAKSTYSSTLFPAWYLARANAGPVLAASHTVTLAARFGRKVRNLVSEHSVTLGYGLSADSTAADRWETNRGIEYYAAGVGTGIAGFRADLGIIDDPVASREMADSEASRETTWQWYNDDFSNRLKPGALELIIMCMTGDTPVMMENGSEKPLRDVRPGDVVATYENGRITTAKIRNWKNQGPDFIYKIRMKSGITVRANERHPFLVERNGTLEWVRISDLKQGYKILRVTGANGATPSVSTKAATSQLAARDFVDRITTNGDGLTVSDPLQSTHSRDERRGSSIDTASTSMSTRPCTEHKTENVLCALSFLGKTSVPTGEGSSASIIATRPARSEGFSATTATSLSDTESKRVFCSERLSTFAVVPDSIVAIEFAGLEDVFDIQVDRTENFIANGLISHNTRWHEDDLAGRLLSRSDPIPTEVLTLPAIAGAEDPLGRSPGQWLWEGEYGYAERLKEKHATSDPRSWSALYQQNPIPEEGIFLDVGRIKRMDAPKKDKMRIFAASDYATSDGGGDYTVHVVGGLDSDDVLHVLDVWRRQTTTDVWVEQMIGMGKSWQPLEWGEPNDIIYKSVSPTIERRMSQERAWINRKPYPQIRDKPTRARPLQARVSQGKLAIAHGAHWAEDLISEMARFPAGKHDDQVDAVALLAVVADTFGPPEKDAVSEEPDTEDYGRNGSFWGNL